jgi:hypothetical protein
VCGGVIEISLFFMACRSVARFRVIDCLLIFSNEHFLLLTWIAKPSEILQPGHVIDGCCIVMQIWLCWERLHTLKKKP